VPFPTVKKACSGDRSTVFEISSGDACWFVKIGGHLAPECARRQWLDGRLPVPEVIAFDPSGDQDALLMSAVPGANLAILAKRLSPVKIVEMVASALRDFHSVNPSGCPFEAYLPGASLVHGDACLPNFRCREDGTVNGYIDPDEMGVGDIEVDLASAVWSLQYNLGPALGERFLRAYGLPAPTDQDVRRLRAAYVARCLAPRCRFRESGRAAHGTAGAVPEMRETTVRSI
jgi:aminoglycoside phosphotransferase